MPPHWPRRAGRHCLCAAQGRSADAATFNEHNSTHLDHVSTLTKINMSSKRALTSFRAKRMMASSLAAVSDTLSRCTRKDNREKKTRLNNNLPPPRKPIVAIGDAVFVTGLQSKMLFRQVASRAPTIVADEFFTSQKCLCGKPLRDDPDVAATPTSRPRRHTTPEAPWPCFAKHAFDSNNRIFDRDVVSGCCIAHCTALGMRQHGEMRPRCFCSAGSWRKKCM